MNSPDNNEKDLLLLIEHFILIANSLKGIKRPTDERIRFAEPLGKKALSHIISAFNLFKGTKFILSDNSYTKSVDFSSIAVLTRAAIETYLTFNYVLINPKDKDEQDFRFICWDMAGFVERENYPAKDEKSRQLKQNEQELKNIKIQELKKNKNFLELNNKAQKLVLNGNWKAGKSWTNLAIHASLSGETFKQIYSYLCSFSHSGRLSIIQIEQTKDFENEQEFGRLFQSINLIILSRLLMDYVFLIPDCKKVFESNKRAVIVTYIWNKIGDGLKI